MPQFQTRMNHHSFFCLSNTDQAGGGGVMASRDGIFRLLRSPRIDSKGSIPPAYVAWQAGTITLFLLGSLLPIDCSKILAHAVMADNKQGHF
jgi:hypothetical protein